MADWSVNWRRVTVLVSVWVIALAVVRWVAVPSAPAEPPPLPSSPPPQPVAAAPYEVEPSPGCQDDNAVRHRGLPAGSTAARPAAPVPFFAERTGTPPADGTPTVAGVKLPRGSWCAHRWVTDVPVADAAALADRLAAKFSETGLWPVLWNFPEDPDHYGDEARALPAAIGRVDVEAVIRRSWREFRMPGDAPFRGLAGGAKAGVEFAPFATFARDWAALESDEDPYLMLVPANRPADAVALVGMPQSELISNAAVAAVLRSWEERFGAVATAVGPGTVDVMATRPPRTEEDALRLAVEQVAIAPEGELGPARDLAADLRTERRGAFTTPRHWMFGWPD